MALAFNESKGEAKKGLNYFKPAMGENKVRLVGGVLPRYMYWLPDVKGKKGFPVECLAFSRTTEKFDNVEYDCFQEYFPKIKCGWGYSINCIHDGEVKVYPLTKKLWAQIVSAAADLGDPTNPETGWEVVFKREKDGPEVYNIAYTLQVLRCKPRPLTEEEIAMVAEAECIDTALPRPTTEEVRFAILRHIGNGDETEDETEDETDAAEKEAVDDLG